MPDGVVVGADTTLLPVLVDAADAVVVVATVALLAPLDPLTQYASPRIRFEQSDRSDCRLSAIVAEPMTNLLNSQDSMSATGKT